MDAANFSKHSASKTGTIPPSPSRKLAIASFLLGLMSVASFLVGILAVLLRWNDLLTLLIIASVLIGIPAIAVGRRAARRARASPELHGGRGLAKVGWITGTVATTTALALLAIGVSTEVSDWRKRRNPQTVCVQNLKQVALALHNYAGDNRQRFPRTLVEIREALGNASALVCPAARDYRSVATGTNALSTRNVSYLYLRSNAELFPKGGARSPCALCPNHNLVAWSDGSIGLWAKRDFNRATSPALAPSMPPPKSGAVKK
jgi:hypothetical protein